MSVGITALMLAAQESAGNDRYPDSGNNECKDRDVRNPECV